MVVWIGVVDEECGDGRVIVVGAKVNGGEVGGQM